MLGMREIKRFLELWQLDAGDVRRRIHLAPTPLEGERWRALWLLAQGWTPRPVGALVRDYLTTPGLRLRLVNLPGYSPDFNADEAVLVREEATGNLCLGTKPLVQEKVRNFFDRLACRQEEVKRRHRTVLQSRAEELLRHAQADSHRPANAHPTLALV